MSGDPGASVGTQGAFKRAAESVRCRGTWWLGRPSWSVHMSRPAMLVQWPRHCGLIPMILPCRDSACVICQLGVSSRLSQLNPQWRQRSAREAFHACTARNIPIFISRSSTGIRATGKSSNAMRGRSLPLSECADGDASAELSTLFFGASAIRLIFRSSQAHEIAKEQSQTSDADALYDVGAHADY